MRLRNSDDKFTYIFMGPYRLTQLSNSHIHCNFMGKLSTFDHYLCLTYKSVIKIQILSTNFIAISYVCNELSTYIGGTITFYTYLSPTARKQTRMKVQIVTVHSISTCLELNKIIILCGSYGYDQIPLCNETHCCELSQKPGLLRD